MSADPLKEPSAVMRENAKVLFDVFNAMQLQGFTEKQALHLIGIMVGNLGSEDNDA